MRKRLLVILVLIGLVAWALTKLDPCGDVNLDGRLNAADLVQMKRHMLGIYRLSSSAVRRADWNKNDAVDQEDLDHWKDVLLHKEER